MQEDFLHYIWRYQKFDWSVLRSTAGEPIVVIHPGEPNKHGGPDFLNARIRLGDTLWAGNVELHMRASEWKQHKHDQDTAYDSVVLHVVLEEDQLILRRNGERLPCLELKGRIWPGMRRSYFNLMGDQQHWVACWPQIQEVDETLRTLWLERISVERLAQRVEKVHALLAAHTGDWEAAFFQELARQLGQPANTEPMEQLLRLAPLALLRKKRDSLFQTEAILFGQAGLLEVDWQEDYPGELQREYAFLKKEFQLTPMAAGAWKFLRMRPANFPTLRIAQLARLVFQTDRLFEKALSAMNAQELHNLFELKVSQYWRTHYRFGQVSAPHPKKLGASTVSRLLINVVAPFMFAYGTIQHSQRHTEQAVRLLDDLAPEDNIVLRNWKKGGWVAQNARQSQALLHLKKCYCTASRCLDCAVGHAILQYPESNL
ncbi:MAG: DUF2851 family protein [Haliscomenobacter sp.]